MECVVPYVVVPLRKALHTIDNIDYVVYIIYVHTYSSVH